MPHPRPRGGLPLFALLTLAVLVAGAVRLAAAVPAALPVQRASEYSVKAALIYNIAKFVTWPASAFPGPGAPLTVCVLGADPFGSVLDETLKDRQIAGRPVIARRVAEPDPSCHVLFVASSEYKRLGVILQKTHQASVLTISDLEGFSRNGGIVEFVTAQDRISFVINARAAGPGLRLSARLLEIAAHERAHEEPR